MGLTLRSSHDADGVLGGNIRSGQADRPGGQHDVAQGSEVALGGQFAGAAGVGLQRRGVILSRQNNGRR